MVHCTPDHLFLMCPCRSFQARPYLCFLLWVRHLQVEALDFALREKDQASALSKLSSTKTALDNVLASVL